MALARARRRRFIPRIRPPAPAPVDGVVLRYRAAMRELVRALRVTVLRALAADIRALRETRNDDAERTIAGVRVSLYRTIETVVSSSSGRAFGSVDRSTTEDVVRQFRSVEVEVLRSVPSVAARFPSFVQENVRLITSVVDRGLGQVARLVERATARGTRAEVLARQILERFDVTTSRAELIARDQVLKLHGAVTRLRQEALGIRRYTWSTSLDERVREMHAELEGTEQRWDDPPVVSEDGRREHPGGDFQCRCVAVPIIDEIAAETAETGSTPEEIARTAAATLTGRLLGAAPGQLGFPEFLGSTRREVEAARVAARVEAQASARTATPASPPPATLPPLQAVPAAAEEFHERFQAAFAGSPFKNHVSHYSPEEIRAKRMTPLLARDGKVGCVIVDHGDGRIEASALFNNGGGPGAGVAMLREAVEKYGVNYVECYAGTLDKLYEKLGFEEISRSPFDPAFAAPDWNYAKFDRPDYVTMRLKKR